ncbi:hypothetical protein [Paenibacillus alvei]|uniref:hypothetical protein n=1 Tax=Paenibacillus alvei TaxID=44250 RepID=UPI0018CF2F8E|nr:hypothetical protein [Paenibacillus alvei]MBG9736808.1 hypothetical protein [Paenibacillus alvei]MBG9746964.1 hypothetical protein [Paenibacillus alvei]MCY9581991.1 hypothetical protein [Paenibacillus alvei]MCY9585889.1 hypothetical protein [Paenibacillus alvei]
MDMRFLAANRCHLTVVGNTKDGLCIEPQEHYLIQSPDPIRLTAAAELYAACQDHEQYLHILYVDCYQQLVHATLHPHTLAVHNREICRNYRDCGQPRRLLLANCNNQLHALLQYRDRVEHIALTGVHWESRGTIHEESVIRSVQLASGNSAIWALVESEKERHALFTLHRFDTIAGKWHPGMEVANLNAEDGNVFSAHIIPAESHDHLPLRLLLLQLARNKLSFALFIQEPSGKLAKKAGDTTIIPNIGSAASPYAVCTSDGDDHCFYLLEKETLYRIHYCHSAGGWGSMYTEPAQQPVEWMLMTEYRDFAGKSMKWIAANHVEHATERIGISAFIKGYQAARDVYQAARLTDRTLTAVDKMRSRRARLHIRLEQLQHARQQRIEQRSKIEERVSILQEEYLIRRLLHSRSWNDRKGSGHPLEMEGFEDHAASTPPSMKIRMARLLSIMMNPRR